MRGVVLKTYPHTRITMLRKQICYKKNITRCYSMMPSKSELTPEELHRITKRTIQEAALAVIGDSEKEKKIWCVKRLTQLLETFDSFIPVVGMFLDNPLVDDLEEKAIELLVEWGWDKFSNDNPNTPNSSQRTKN